jgi:transcriptional regulator with XRE-family HTH domain
MSPNYNRVAAARLRQARQLKGWTQAEAAERLEKYLGARWSPTVFSQVESSASEDRRLRRFDADVLVAISKMFDLPVSWFLTEDDLAAWRALVNNHTHMIDKEAKTDG